MQPRWLRALALAFSLVLLATGRMAFADGPDANAIVKALLPKAKAPIYRSLFNRGVEVTPDPQPAADPQIDLMVNFDFDSANLTNDGALTLAALGKALADARLKDLRFRIIGHTDARGSPSYNQLLSEQRAETVGSFLYQFYQVDRSRLEISGKGSSELKDPLRPWDGINRRVQIVTILPQTRAPPADVKSDPDVSPNTQAKLGAIGKTDTAPISASAPNEADKLLSSPSSQSSGVRAEFGGASP